MSTKLAHFHLAKKFLNTLCHLIVGVMKVIKVYRYFAFASAFLDEHITQIKLKGSRPMICLCAESDSLCNNTSSGWVLKKNSKVLAPHVINYSERCERTSWLRLIRFCHFLNWAVSGILNFLYRRIVRLSYYLRIATV